MLASPTGPSEMYFVIGEFEFSRGALGFPGGSGSEEPTFNARAVGLIPGLGSSPGEGSGNPVQCSYLETPMDSGAWWATVQGVAKSQTRLNDQAHLSELS